MSRMIPPLGTRGLYSLKAPWSTEPNVLYSCAAIRSFVDLDNLGTDIFETYYAPMGLGQDVYNRDRRNDEAIITLVSETTAPIYVPSSYIASYPDLTHRNYHHVVVSASLGMIPDYIDLTFLKDQIQAVISDVVGVASTVHVGVAPVTGVISPEQHEILEAARQAAITNRTTDYARNLLLQQKNQQLEQRLAVMEEILKSRGLIPQ